MFTNLNQKLSTTLLGQSVQMGTGEAFGFVFGFDKATSKITNKGFLGLRSKIPMSEKLGGALGLAGTVWSAYQGYREEGLYGAAKGTASSVLSQIAFSYARISSGTVIPVALIGAAGYGFYRFGEAAQAYRKRVRKLEMGNTNIDVVNSAGALTERSRALNALNSSHINGRIALGNEAILVHNSYSR